MSRPPAPLRVLVIGAGAIGCFVGGRLAAAGQDVTLVGRARFAQAVARRGLELRKPDGATETIRAVRAVASVPAGLEPSAPQFDLAILTVKSYDTAQALAELAAAVEAGGVLPQRILSLQNGVGNEEAIAARFGPPRVIAGTITAPVAVPEAGVVQVTKPSYAIGLAVWEGGQAFVERVGQALDGAGIPVRVYADAAGMKWSKLLMNTIGNATSAILAVPPSQTFAHPRLANLEIDSLREALRVMAAAGIGPLNVEKYPLGTLAPLLRFGPKPLLRVALRRIVAGARGGKMPSLFLDLDAGKSKSEVGWYNGAVVAKGVEVGVPTPVNRLLLETVQALVRNPAQRANWQGNFARLAGAYAQTLG